MNYGGNMPDWHQYNASQTNEITPTTQNVNSGHLTFIPGVNHPTLNALSLNSDGLNKHQSDANYNPRNFQSYNNVSNGPNIPNNSPLASMVQMQNCIGHYGSTNTRNPMLDNINASVDHRNAAVGTINDEIGYRTNQVPFNGPIGHLSGSSCNLNASSGPIPGPGSGPGSGFGPRTNSGPGSNTGTNSGNGTGSGNIFGPGSRHGSVQGSGSGNLGPRNTNIGSVPSGKPGPTSFMPCKGACCNSDPNINYQQWEKFGPYQNNSSFRDNVHPSSCQMENRHFANNCNFRKDNLEGKEARGPVLPNAPAIDHRRNYNDYKYHKDHLVHRNYSTSSGMFHNYPVQNYNYSTEHQKYTYPVKEHPKTNNMNISNSGMLKHPEQNFINQQKFNNKQFQYQNGNVLPKGVPTLNVNTNMASSSQNPYFNAQYPQNIATEMNHECQETTDNAAIANRMPSTFMHSSSPQHQVYQHKIAMQKFSMENHLRELSRIPGYQSHPKYKECVLRYKELVKLQQSTGYLNPVQQTSRVATPVNAAVPPINLQFDQNGMLINSNYNPDAFPKVHHAPAMKQPPDNIEKQTKDQAIAIANEKCQMQQPEQLMIPSPNEHVPSSCAETFQKQNQFSVNKDFNQNQLKVQTSESHNFDTLNAIKSNETAMAQQKVSKEFANKPQLDVRQFLANWDETDDEDGTTSNLPNSALNETTPVVVVSYENVNISPKTPQGTEASERNTYRSNETELNNEKVVEPNVIAAQDCLTISYSPTDSGPQIAKTSKRTIKEGVMKPGSIIHCISNGPDEIPTIHIVDNLEISNILGTSGEQVIQTLEKQKAISFFRETNSNETETMTLEDTEQQDKNETDVLSTSYDGSLDNVTKDTNCVDSNPVRTTAVSINSQELRSSAKSNLDVASNMDLKKQNSFASEESHHPDDISLPDLPTSECTPISTTLNTPIHSDTEESSQNMEDLSISTNPIEVMQNSPVISFTQLNSEEKSKSGSLGTLDLEFRKQNTYKANEQEVTLGNFDFSATNSKVKSGEIVKGKQAKSLAINTARKKVFPIDGKETDARVSDTCAALTFIEYEPEVEQESVEGEKSSESGFSGCTYERKHKSARKSTDLTKTVIRSGDSVDNIVRDVVSTRTDANLSPTESDEEMRSSRRRKVKSSTVFTNTNHSEIDLNARKRAKETSELDNRGVNKYSERSVVHRKDTDHLRRSKSSETRRFDEEHSACHMTSQHKHYSVAVIKNNNITLSDKRSGRSTDRTAGDKSPEPQTRTANNTKELSEEMEIKKHVSGKLLAASRESVQFQSSRKSELFRKDLKPADGDVRYTAGEIRMLKEYRRKKEKLHQDKSKQHSLKTTDEEFQKNQENSSHSRNKIECLQTRQSNEHLTTHGACSEQNVLSMVNLSAKKLDAREEGCSKSCCKNADVGIQVANVNLKIKDSDVGSELIRRDKYQEQRKDSREGIKIEINVSCKDQSSKSQEQNKRLLYDDRDLYEIHEPPGYTSNALDCHCRLHAKEQETVDASKIDRAHRSAEKSIEDAVAEVASTSTDTTFKKRRRTSMGTNEDNACVPTTDGQPFGNDASCKDTAEGSVRSVDDTDTVKLKCAVSNAATADANNKVKAKSKFEGGSKEADNRSRNLETTKVQKSASTSLVEASTTRQEEKELASVVHRSKSAKKMPDNSPEANAKSLSSLDYNLDYKKYSNASFDGELDDDYPGRWKKPKIDQILEDCDVFQSSSGYVNPIFSSIDKLEDLHTVPVYTTKDGKISYSPNRRCTYHELMIEARKREACLPARRSHYGDTWNNYYSSKFRKLYKKKRHHPFNDRKKHEFKNTKYLYDRKRNYSDEFYGRRYKDYVHSVKNNNAVWTDHDSSSDSDEEIVNCNKSGLNETGKKDHTVESKARNQTIDEADPEHGYGEDVTDACLSKDKDTYLEEPRSVQFQSLDGDAGNENCQDHSNNVNNNLVLTQTDASSTITLDHGKEDIVSDQGDCLTSGKSCDLSLEKPESIGSKDLDNNEPRLESRIGESKGSVVSGNEEESIRITDGSLTSVLLDEVPSSNENEQTTTIVEEEKKSEMCLLKTTDLDKQEAENDTKVSGDQTSAINDVVNIDVEVDKDVQDNQTELLEFDTNDCFSTKEASELHADSGNAIERVSQESVEPEKHVEVFDEVIEESSENIVNKEENSVIFDENISECKEENVQLTEEIIIVAKELEREECTNEETKENTELSMQENSGDSPNEAENESSEDQKKSESQTMEVDATIDQQNNSEYTLFETVENQKDINASEQTGNEEPSLMDLSKYEIYIENDYVCDTESLVATNRDGMDIALSDMKETSAEKQEIIDHPKDRPNEDGLDEPQNTFERNSSRNSSVEKEMPVLSEYRNVENPENNTDKPEENEEREKQDRSSFIDPHDSSGHSSDNNADAKAIPKLIIKKTDASNPKPEANCTEVDNCVDRYDAKLLPETRPKIPKMIIVKSRSRSATPTIELLEKTKSERTAQPASEDNDSNVNVDNSDSEQYTLKYDNYENKVPKVKIKLEDISSKDLKLYLKRKVSKKSVPKVKIKKLKPQDIKVYASISKLETEHASETDTDCEDQESVLREPTISDAESEKVPKLRLKKQDGETSPERTREKDSSVSKVTPKKSKRTKDEDTKIHATKQDNVATNDDALRKKFPQYIVEKIPKVIIKRTQIGAEFKCEISKGRKTSVAETSKWQPQVKLQRLELLDHIVKDLKHSKITLKDIFNAPTPGNGVNDTASKDSTQGNKVKLSRSNSASNLSPVKYKQRRLSDSGCTKTDTKSAAEFNSSSRDTDDRVAGLISVDNEDRCTKKKSKKRLFSQNKRVDANEESQTEQTVANSFRNFLMNKHDDLMISKSEYSSFMAKEGTSSAENKFLESGVASSHNYDNNDNSIIKIESSDESQTTIEILPASPDSCDGETDKNCEFESMDRQIENAIPTQLELELELIDNNIRINDHASHSRSRCADEKRTNTYFSEFQCSSETAFRQNVFEQSEQSSETASNDYFYCNDLLVKEVLAAKEALKKCLTRPENQDAEKRKSRPKTVAEKKQGLSFDFKGFDEPSLKDSSCNDGSDNAKARRKSKSLEKKEHKSPGRVDIEEAEEKKLSVEKGIASLDSQNEMVYTVECSTASSTCGHDNVPESATISLKASKKTNEADVSEATDKHNNANEVHGEKSKKKTNSSVQKQGQKNDDLNDAKTKEDNMPLLVPEFALNFDSSSDRDSSRSPPVITNQEEADNGADGEKTIGNKLITTVEKIEESKQDSYKNCEMTIADIITQLAYHDKATIKHRRYCNLCERWFPTTSRHRRHLAGYQHRYMELTQRKSIHALFILFTGKPCPRLLPANVIRNDCSIGELTPLQIAVQDIAKCVEYTQQNLKTKE